MVVLDEIVTSILTGLVTQEEVLEIMNLAKEKGSAELVMTGRGASQELIDQADLVTEMKKVKHYFDKKQPARLGIEF